MVSDDDSTGKDEENVDDNDGIGSSKISNHCDPVLVQTTVWVICELSLWTEFVWCVNLYDAASVQPTGSLVFLPLQKSLVTRDENDEMQG